MSRCRGVAEDAALAESKLIGHEEARALGPCLPIGTELQDLAVHIVKNRLARIALGIGPDIAENGAVVPVGASTIRFETQYFR